MKKKLRERNGEFILSHALELVVLSLLMVLFISALGVVNQLMTVHSMAAELSRYIEIRGQVDNAVHSELSRLERVSGIDVDCRISASYIRGTSKIQFGDEFTVTLSGQGQFGIGGLIRLGVPLRSTVAGRSEQYWKS